MKQPDEGMNLTRAKKMLKKPRHQSKHQQGKHSKPPTQTTTNQTISNQTNQATTNQRNQTNPTDPRKQTTEVTKTKAFQRSSTASEETRRIEAAGGQVQAVRRGTMTTYRVNGRFGALETAGGSKRKAPRRPGVPSLLFALNVQKQPKKCVSSCF